MLSLGAVLFVLRMLSVVLPMLHVRYLLPMLHVLRMIARMLPCRERGSRHDQCRRRCEEGKESPVHHRVSSSKGSAVGVQNQKRIPATRRVSSLRPPASLARSSVSPYLRTHSTPTYGANWRVIS